MSDALTIGLNAKQHTFLATVTSNRADFIQQDPEHPSYGLAYQGGYRACFQGARGSGKTNVLLRLIAESSFELPQALCGLAARTYKQVQDIVLSQSKQVWEEYGLIEYNTIFKGFGHYVVNTRPPAHWPKPHNAPRTYDNTVTFCNGYTIIMISADRPETQRGLNLDQLFIDESATISRNFMKVIRPSVRANKFKYSDARPDRQGYNNPLHWLVCDFTSAPWFAEGHWVYDTEDRMKADPSRYFYLESTALDNLQFLPGNYIDEQREAMDELEFLVEIMNKRVRASEGGFYSAFNYTNHTYSKIKYTWNSTYNRYDDAVSDYDPNKPIEISFDFNSRFTSMVVAQDHGTELRFIDSFYVKTSTTTLIDALMSQFHAKYSNHKKKRVLIYGDSGGKKIDPNQKQSIYSDIKDTFKGWVIEDKVRNFNTRQKFKYKIVNTLLSEQREDLPHIRLNAETCKPLIISIEFALIDGDYDKDKARERQKNFPQEHATHFSDAFDYMLIEKYSRKIETKSTRRRGIVIRSAAA
jgi:hypothetical protein